LAINEQSINKDIWDNAYDFSVILSSMFSTVQVGDAIAWDGIKYVYAIA